MKHFNSLQFQYMGRGHPTQHQNATSLYRLLCSTLKGGLENQES